MQVFLVYYYITLAIRESILRENGSRIKVWWIWHHYFSMLLCTVMLTWPKGLYYLEFRSQFLYFVFYTGCLQVLQTNYQMGRMYKQRALGQKSMMDVTQESVSIKFPWTGKFQEMSFLIPFVFVAQAFQVYNAWTLFYFCVDGAEWQAYVLCALFLILACGNFSTTILILKQRKESDQLKRNSTPSEPGSASAPPPRSTSPMPCHSTPTTTPDSVVQRRRVSALAADGFSSGSGSGGKNVSFSDT
eukprot:gnl/Spiro4/6915_TR3580_c0_g1_i1.p1 gnl/Spiro4/6915_TR3580_c0_g1~~gnl/Spiro4/6915_TR3580_c0_g1_i1.p1  ORF type:complete len:245 (+),score=25.62 gnl/Spiro4/6915_TR3580_c0_g1_i1:504-1238(+)